MASLSNGPTTEGSVVVTGTEMESPVADNLRLVDDRNKVSNGEPPIDHQLDEPAKKLGLGFGTKSCSRPSRGLLILITASLVGGLSVTVSLIVQIYLGPYEVGRYGGVAADVPQCSRVGADMLQKGGSAVDAAIAALFCVGVCNAHSSGIGGGGFMIVYDHKKDDSECKVIDFRETAPSAANSDAYKDSPKLAEKGSMSVGVPGELRGLEAAHKQYGRLLWKDLIQPSIDIATNGFNVTEEILKSLKKVSIEDFTDENLKKIFVRDGKFVDVGDRIVRPELAATLSVIAEKGAGAFYEGDIADSIVNATEGKVTLTDLKEYTVIWRDPVKSTYKDKTVLSMPPPGSGPTLLLMLNIMEGFNWTSQDQDLPITYRRMLETFRYGYAQRTKLADPDFVSSVKKSSDKMISKEEAKRIRDQILSYSGTKSVESYLPDSYMKTTGGTTHVSAADSKELYVSVTSTINWRYGSKLMTNTGILLNNELADFDFPSNTDWPNSVHNNLIEPKKRCLSAMTPTILYTSKEPCLLRMAIGGANGTRIITGVAETIVNMLSFGMNLTAAIEKPRIHDQLFENTTDVEGGFPADILANLTEMGYHMNRVEEGISDVLAVKMFNDTTVAHSDTRKAGEDGAVAINES